MLVRGRKKKINIATTKILLPYRSIRNAGCTGCRCRCLFCARIRERIISSWAVNGPLFSYYNMLKHRTAELSVWEREDICPSVISIPYQSLRPGNCITSTATDIVLCRLSLPTWIPSTLQTILHSFLSESTTKMHREPSWCFFSSRHIPCMCRCAWLQDVGSPWLRRYVSITSDARKRCARET